MQKLNKEFNDRKQLVDYVRKLSPWAKGESSLIIGGKKAAQEKLLNIDPIAYANSRNYSDGKVTKLSPYIQHGIITLNEVRNHALTLCSEAVQITKLIQELAWRDFWKRVIESNPSWAWEDVEEYKTGFNASDYKNFLPDDILKGKTGIACIDSFIQELISTGYLHNHARLYLASYIVHFRRIKWQEGALWFLHHLLDGNIASNNLSWQWVASTFSNKPYIFNLENVNKYFGKIIDTSPLNNQLLNASYDELQSSLFPNLREKK